MPVISVIVPVYNTEKYLHRCVDSILAQTYSDFELLLVDDGSTDASGFICDKYKIKDSRIRVFHQVNRGQAVARNYALDWIFSNSKSEYIAFVDSDDWVHPRFLELLLKGITRYNANICQCGYLETDVVCDFNEVSESGISISPENQYIQYYSAFMWDKLFHKNCWKEMRFPEGQIYEDVAIWFKILFKEKEISLIKDVLYYYFLNPTSTVHNHWTPAKLAQVNAWEEQLLFTEKYGNRRVLEVAIKRTCWVLMHQYEEISSSTMISKTQRLFYKIKIKNKLRKVILKYKNEPAFKGEYLMYFDYAFPVRSWLYWTCVGIKGKIRRIFIK